MLRRSSHAAWMLPIPLLLAAALGGCPMPSVGGNTNGNGNDNSNDNGTPSTSLRPPGIYVTNQDDAVVVFGLTASGDVAPQRRIEGPHTGLSLPIGIAMDSKGSIYVANRTGSSVTVYDGDADGDAEPIRTLTNPDMGSPESIVIGPGDEVFVSTCPGCGSGAGGQTGVFHFANGASASDFRIGGTSNINTGFTVPSSLAIQYDPSNPSVGANIIVGNSFGGNIALFGERTIGDQFPIRTLQPRAGANLQSIAFAGNALFVTVPGAGVDIYPADALSTAEPSATLAFGPTFQYPAGIAVDAGVSPPVGYLVDYSGNAVYVLHTIGVAPNLEVESETQIAGSQTTLNGPLGVLAVR